MTWWDSMWHRRLGRPYRLAKIIDEGNGPIVVMLHGIGRDASVWRPLVTALTGTPCRVVAFDLLGFGASPKPSWLRYSVDDHAAAVLAAIKHLPARQPIIVVGHSMGSLIAVRVARLAPERVKQLVLYEMPIYEGLPNKRRYRWRVEAYRALYQQITMVQPVSKTRANQVTRRLVERATGQNVAADGWQPFVKSLQHTIMEQATSQDIVALSMPIDVIYGSRDNLVIRGKVKQIFGSDRQNITAHTIRERHLISTLSAKFLAARITIALQATATSRGHSRLQDILRES